jgi:flagellar biosynthetic protein FlhB
MAGADSAQERTEQPTAKRRGLAREEGRVARSPELTSAAATLAGTALLGAGGAAAIGVFTGRQFAASAAALARGENEGAGALIGDTRAAIFGLLATLLPLFGAIALSVVGAGLAQTRGVVSFKSIAFKWSNVNPAAGLKRLLGTEAAVALLRSLAKISAIGFLAWGVLVAAQPELLALAGAGPAGIAAVIKSYSLRLAYTTVAAFFVLAVADWLWRWYQLEKSLRMTRQEIVQENRESEGDPLVKSRQLSIARARARQRMLQNVRKADVVVTNPTHVAVALQYDLDAAPAPVVLAMGQRKLAQRIKELARKYNVPVIENPPIARALLATAQVGKPIPSALYAAIAEILAFVYRQRGRLPGGGRLTPEGSHA